jgi:CPA2 family monovalent cation:H+ antiporter-2
MVHHTPLVATVVVGIALAFALGVAAHRARVSPLVGYLLAGVAVGPFTPGFVADAALAAELADIGVILLLFAVGLHFSPRDLLAVRAVALPGALAAALLLTLAKVAAFVAVMLLAGRRVIPWVLHFAAHTGSRELFRLAVYAVALGVAYGAAALFGVSFALGAFFAGMVMSESQLSQRAAEEALPLRDASAVLFFVSVGMLFDPAVLVAAPWAVLATVGIVVLGKPAVAFLIVRGFGHPAPTALTIAASLAQIGEFSFILAGLGVALGALPEDGRDLVLAAAILSILLNPLLFAAAERLRVRAAPAPAPAAVPPEVTGAAPTAAAAERRGGPQAPPTAALADHDVLVGYGRVGALVGAGLLASGRPLLVVEEAAEAVAAARRDGAEVVVVGNAADPAVLGAANLAAARRLFVTVPEAFEAGEIVGRGRAANPALAIVARAHSDAATAHLAALGARLAVMGEREIACRMLEYAAAAPATPSASG